MFAQPFTFLTSWSNQVRSLVPQVGLAGAKNRDPRPQTPQGEAFLGAQSMQLQEPLPGQEPGQPGLSHLEASIWLSPRSLAKSKARLII